MYSKRRHHRLSRRADPAASPHASIRGPSRSRHSHRFSAICATSAFCLRAAEKETWHDFAIGSITIKPSGPKIHLVRCSPRADIERRISGAALALLNEAKRLSPRGIDLLVNKDNARAIRFYEKHGFVYAGEDKNPVSGKPVNRMSWRP